MRGAGRPRAGSGGPVRAAIAVLAAGLATAALAGGPLYTYDYANRIPYSWNVASSPNGHVPVYTDLGPLGILSNAQADALVAGGISQWSSVPTSSFRGAVAGDFSALGLGDIDDTNITSIIGTWNGGGIDVVYDRDGAILTNFFGVPPASVLGITSIDFVSNDSPEILESWTVLSGPGIEASDANGVGFAGVVTHELGHDLNLAHSQANGAALEPGILDPPQPEACSSPWSQFLDPSQIETMYPFLHPAHEDTGEYAATVDRIDDRSALSDIYPAAGWPANTASIHGRILDASGNPVTGVDVIARNVADPFNDCDSYISGQVSKGQAGPDGSFVMNGLTPGASYALYADKLEDGAFAVPTVMVLPGPEEFFNGQAESGNFLTDDPCLVTPVTATVGTSGSVDIALNHLAGAPTLITAPDLSVQSLPTGITPDGAIVVGGEGPINVPIFRWDVNAGTFETIGGSLVGNASISDDGSRIAANLVGVDGINRAAIYQNGAWTALPASPGAVPCGNSGSGLLVTSTYDISGDGSTVVGLSYGTGGCSTSTIRGFKWTAAGGTVQLPKADSFSRAGRANSVNYDGSVIVGWDDASNGQRRGEQWRNGVPSLIKKNNLSVAEALEVSRDGLSIVGLSSSVTNFNAWMWTQSGGVQNLGAQPNQTGALASAVNDDASVIVGRSTDLNAGTTTPILWTSGLHWTDLNQFLGAQGVVTSGIELSLPMSMTPDGRTITGFASSRIGYLGWVLKTPTSVVCHATTDPPGASTQTVSFPQGLNAALAQGDTLGPCPCVDMDGDGYTNCTGECNDGNPAVHPGAAEVCNAIDDDCDGVVDDAPAPEAHPALTLAKTPGNTQLSWSAAGGATAYDVFSGDLQELHGRAGDFASLTQSSCVGNDLAATTLLAGGALPAPGGGRWFVVRAVNCGGTGTYDEGGMQQASRDAGIHSSSGACP